MNNKKLFLSSEKLEKCFYCNGIKQQIVLTDTNSFDYNVFCFIWPGTDIRCEIDSRYVEYDTDNDKYTVCLNLHECGYNTRTLEVFPEIHTKHLMRDKEGEYFYIYTPNVCYIDDSNYILYKKRVSVLSFDPVNKKYISISTKNISDELVYNDILLSEVNRTIAELEETHRTYETQKKSLNFSIATNEPLKKAYSKLYLFENEIAYYREVLRKLYHKQQFLGAFRNKTAKLKHESISNEMLKIKYDIYVLSKSIEIVRKTISNLEFSEKQNTVNEKKIALWNAQLQISENIRRCKATKYNILKKRDNIIGLKPKNDKKSQNVKPYL